MGRIVQQPLDRVQDRRGIGAHELRATGGQRLRTLGFRAGDDHRLGQRGRLLLHPAGVGDHQMAALKQAHEGQVALRGRKADVAAVAERPAHRALDLGVQMQCVEDFHVVAPAQDLQGAADLQQAWAEAFAPMPGDQDQPLAGREGGKGGVDRAAKLGLAPQSTGGLAHRVDAGVAGDEDPPGEVFSLQVVARTLRRGEQQVADDIDRSAVGLLRPRTTWVVGAQPGLDVGDRNLTVEGGETSCQRRRRVALDQHAVGTHLRQHGVQGAHGRAYGLVDRLARV